MLLDIVKEIDAIYDLSGFVATLDIMVSFATVKKQKKIKQIFSPTKFS